MLEDDHFYTQEYCQKLLRQKQVIKRSKDDRVTPELNQLFSSAVKEDNSVQSSSNWPMLVLRNDFA